MAYVPGYKHDVFVSYAHFDNERTARMYAGSAGSSSI